MLIKVTTEWRTWDATSKLGKKYKKRRRRHLYHLECDACGAKFTRAKGTMDPARLDAGFRHLCRKCGKNETMRFARQKRIEKWQGRVGEKIIDSQGYVAIYMGDTHPYRKSYGGRIREHVVVMENHIGRELQKDERVHHIDGDKTNNALDNLDLCTAPEHNNCHGKMEQIVFELYKRGWVTYDRTTKTYSLAV